MAAGAEKRSLGELKRVAQAKRVPARETARLGPEMVAFFKNGVEKRQVKFGKIVDYWSRALPEVLERHCALESFSRGQLMVLVDSSPHLYELRQMLLGGLEKQMVGACKTAGLKKITLKLGRWYEGEGDRDQKLRF